MKKLTLVSFLLFCTFLAFSQDGSDTFRIQNFPLKIWHGAERVKKIGKLEPIVLSKNDLKIRQDWQNGKTIRGIGLGVQAAGVIMMGLSLSKTANGDDGSSLLLGGAAMSLGGIVIQIGGVSKAKKALRRYNDIEAGRIAGIPGNSPSQPGNSTYQAISGEQAGMSKMFAGIRMGFNFARQKDTNEEFYPEEFQTLTGSQMLVPVEFSMSERLSLQVELGYVQKGGKYYLFEEEGQGYTKTTRTWHRMSYVELPVCLKAYLPPVGKVSFYGLGGLSCGYLAKFKIKEETEERYFDQIISSTEEETNLDLSNADLKNRLDFSLHLGGGAVLPAGPGKFFAEARYQMGIYDYSKTDDTPSDWKIFHRGIGLTVGYMASLNQSPSSTPSPTKEPTYLSAMEPHRVVGDTIKPPPPVIPPTPAAPKTVQLAQIQKGGWLLGASASLAGGYAASSGEGNAVGISVIKKNGQSQTIINLSPKVGYFVQDGLMLGGNLHVYSVSGDGGSSSLAMIGPMVRYYAGGTAKMKFTGEAGVSLGSRNYTTGNNARVVAMSLGPGISLFLNEKVSLDFQAVYEHASTKRKGAETATKESGFGVRVGFGVFL